MRVAPLLLALALVAPAAHATARSAPRTRRLAQRTSAAQPAAAHPAQATPTTAHGAAAQPAPAHPAPAGTAGAPAPAATNATPPVAPEQPGVPLTADQVAAHVQSFYDRTNDYEANYQQVSHNRLTGRDERRSGHVRFLKPGRMRWDYALPSGDVVVSDGTTLWAYEAAEHQAVQSDLRQSQLPSALSFLTGTGRLTNDFTFTLLDAQRYQYPTGYVLQLQPIQPNPSFERIIFFVDRASFQVASTVVLDAQGNSNRFTFTDVRVNVSPAQSVFQWTPPRGTQIVRP
jgi:outer membrane lipoprotein carrier protein